MHFLLKRVLFNAFLFAQFFEFFYEDFSFLLNQLFGINYIQIGWIIA